MTIILDTAAATSGDHSGGDLLRNHPGHGTNVAGTVCSPSHTALCSGARHSKEDTDDRLFWALYCSLYKNNKEHKWRVNPHRWNKPLPATYNADWPVSNHFKFQQ
ncbi:hypothetical protein ILYODFUR_036931 [Ilyodon furcidens]|uniref:Uncharacterized protein n=1 Tax=Ilyodon furcidens TaxID=33524 RepID=A0ABV0V965_9TELE